MTAERHPGCRTAVFAAGRCGRLLRPAAFAAALAALLLPGVPAAAEPTVKQQRFTPPAGSSFTLDADEVFENAGTNPGFLEVEFSTAEFYGPHTGIYGGRLWVNVKSDADLRALPSPPPNPFEVTATVTMINDEGEKATTALALETSYETDASVSPPAAGPVVKKDRFTVPVGIPVPLLAEAVFANAGTNPGFTEVEFSTGDYYQPRSGIYRGRLWVETRPLKALRALPSPPPNPFTVTVTVTMANDEGETATAELTLETPYDDD